MPTLRYVDTESVSEGGESETKDQVPRQKRPVDTNHKAKASATVAAAAASCNTATEANQTPHQRRPVDANHCAGSTVVAAAADGAASPAGTADSNKAPKSWKKLHGRGDGTNNTAPAQNPSLPSSTNTSPAKGGQSVRPVAPTKKIRRSCSMPNCIKPSRGPRYNHMCSIHMSEDSAGTGSASASRFKGTGDRTHRPPRQQKTASALKKSREPALGVDRDAADQKIPTAPSTPPLISSKAATGKSPMNFLFKLYAMLDDASSDDPDRDCQVPGAPSKKKLSQIVAFQPSGRAFKIHDDKVFRSHVLPLYFGKASFLTFKHLMNHYGFVRLTKGTDKGCYFNALFRQNHKHLVHLIKPGRPAQAAAAPSQRALEEGTKIAFQNVGDLHVSAPKASVGRIDDANYTGKKIDAPTLSDTEDDNAEDYCEV